MKNVQIVQAFDEINPDESTEKKILENILFQLPHEKKMAAKRKWGVIIPIAACIAVGIAVIPKFFLQNTTISTDYSSELSLAPAESIERVLYIPNQSMSGLDTAKVEVEGTADALLEALAKRDVLPEEIHFRSFLIENDGTEIREKVGDSEIVSYHFGENTVAFADLPASFVEYLDSLEPQAEELVVKSIAVTFIENYDLTGMIITVDGSPLKTARNDYSAELKK